MERKIGEVFELQGTKLKVTENTINCEGCFLDGRCTKEAKNITGFCSDDDRTDNKNVVFAEVTDEEQSEQPAPEKAQKLNLCEKLKYCPEGTRFWSPMLGDVKFISILSKSDKISVLTDSLVSWDINADATITFGIANRKTKTTEEPMLFPSREQRDWSKVDYKLTIDMLPKTWEEFCKTHEVQKGEAYFDTSCGIIVLGENYGTRLVNTDKNTLPSKEAAEAHLALMQLHQLRDCWRDGWKPEPNKTIWGITKDGRGDIELNSFDTVSVFLSFQDEERAELFVKHFRNIIMAAGDLI